MKRVSPVNPEDITPKSRNPFYREDGCNNMFFQNAGKT
jgi:hypothetical protein